ncbi:MAG: hypothetical protein ACRDTC_17915 [Pseudonocardiaceae bacterium]
MAQPMVENGDRVSDASRRVSSDPTMLKVLLRERHWQNYGMFTRAYQNAATSLDKHLARTYPSLSTFRRWLAGQVQDLPHAGHCAVLEAMLPGWSAAELFQPPHRSEDIDGSIPLPELLRRRCLHHYREFCRAYDLTAAMIDPNLVGSHPTEPQFHQWIGGQVSGLPHPGHCAVLEAMFPGHSARDLFALTESSVAEPAEPAEPASAHQPATAMPAVFSRAIGDGNGDTGVVWGRRRIVGCDARGVPFREEVRMAADESAQFQRWSATTNVDDTVLEQMTADVAELAHSEQVDPPALVYARLLGARDDVFRLIAGQQQPRHTIALYKIASQITAMLAMVTFDLGYPDAANTHARTALHCVEMSGYTPIRVVIRWIQSLAAYWAGRYDEAAELMDAARPDATSGTTLLRLTSQLARTNAARHRPDEVTRVLALAETAPTERTPDEPGVFGFETVMATYYASEAHCALGGTEHLDTAVDLAHTALEELSAQTQPKITYIASARFDLALAYLGKGQLEAVGEHLAPILGATGAEYRTVPVIGRARSLHTLLAARTDLASGTLTTLRDDLAGFITHPAPTPPHLEPGAT